MTVFKTFLKILNKNKFIIIMYTVILVVFGGLNMSNSDNNGSFVSAKPDILIINNDENIGITKDLISYIENNSNIIDVKQDDDAINDALFYRDVNYIIYIPANFRKDFLEHKNPKIEVKSTGDYQASFAEMLLERYIKVASIYSSTLNSEDDIIKMINSTLDKSVTVEITSKLDTDNLSRITSFYNFSNYSLLAGCVYVICLILSSFRNEMIRRRTIISSTNYKEYNRYLLISNGLFAFVLWLFYVILSFILLGNSMFTMHGAMYIINSFIFTICSLTLAFLIANVVSNKEAINGIVNVIALGSSFLCGAFVPMEWLPNSVLNIAHILPSYWFIKSNELIKEIEVFNLESISPVIINMIVVLSFSCLFIIITNIISSKKQKFN